MIANFVSFYFDYKHYNQYNTAQPLACACQYFAIQFKKHTLEFNYYFQVDVSQFSSHLPFAI